MQGLVDLWLMGIPVKFDSIDFSPQIPDWIYKKSKCCLLLLGNEVSAMNEAVNPPGPDYGILL